ncbi:hypothetical protein CEXT_606821 [Caerostris extrusa]|uniref:Uncharacterized protein n=1 Tax=Caerostris extrusa TaxID=172846 RepID=A0AAV4UJE8_CAEEX|nr:hypothetical protein CEXT_606821 [Caerostris extrusa]
MNVFDLLFRSCLPCRERWVWALWKPLFREKGKRVSSPTEYLKEQGMLFRSQRESSIYQQTENSECIPFVMSPGINAPDLLFLICLPCRERWISELWKPFFVKRQAVFHWGKLQVNTLLSEF